MAIIGANEIYRKLSSQIESQFSGFLRDDAPKFIAFLKAYFEYMEQSKDVIDASRGLFDYQDIDRTLDEFVEYFQREFMPSIPRNVLVDKRLLAKYIRQFYRARGSQESYRFLFRILFNTEIDFYYPGDDILRASDGRWVRETVLRGTRLAGNPDLLNGRQVTGSSSGARGRVQEVLRITVLGVQLIQVRIEQVTGTFTDFETITDGLGNSIVTSNLVGGISTISVFDGGAFHRTGDTVNITGESGGIANGVVTSTTDETAMTFRIVKGGSGYRISNSTISITGGNPTKPAQFKILNLSNTQNVTINQNVINPMRNVVLNTGSTFVSLGSNTSAIRAALAAANISSTITSALTFATHATGTINTISLLTTGHGYTSKPTATVLDLDIAAGTVADGFSPAGIKGQNAVIVSNTVSGTITGISIFNTNDSFVRNDVSTITNTSRSAANTTDTSLDTKGLTRGVRRKGLYSANTNFTIASSINLAGRYLDTKGFLSSDKKLQDNYYYQEFSYVIRVSQLVSDYKNVVKSLLHPSGTIMFGNYNIESTLDVSSFDVDTTSVTTGSEATIDFTIALAAETVTLTDSVTGKNSTTGALTETITTSDSIVPTHAMGGVLSETVTITDSVVGVSSAVAAISESVTAAEVVVGALSTTAGISETITMSDSFVGVSSAVAAISEGSGFISSWADVAISSYAAVVIQDFIAGVLSLDDTVV